MRDGDKVRITSGEHEGKTGKVIGPIPMSQVQDLAAGQDISMEGAINLWIVEFDDGGGQTVEKEDNLEHIGG